MRIHIDFSGLKRSQWHEHVLRFVFGGVITVATGLVAKHFGAVIGGLFLAFPAIFPASLTLVSKHEREKKQKAGLNGTLRGKMAAALDARGSVIGSIGLGCFALLVWKLLLTSNAFATLSLAMAAWLAASIFGWYVEQKYLRRKAGPKALAPQR
ncbi:MAG: DUF3147 family protein [Candidatus Acidiferrum sp.]